MTLGSFNLATENRARTSFSPSPTHFEVKELAEMLKNVALHCDATHLPENPYFYNKKIIFETLPIIVFPVPGGPNSKTPLGGARMPVKTSLDQKLANKKEINVTYGLLKGKTTISLNAFFAPSNPETSDHPVSVVTDII